MDEFYVKQFSYGQCSEVFLYCINISKTYVRWLEYVQGLIGQCVSVQVCRLSVVWRLPVIWRLFVVWRLSVVCCLSNVCSASNVYVG